MQKLSLRLGRSESCRVQANESSESGPGSQHSGDLCLRYRILRTTRCRHVWFVQVATGSPPSSIDQRFVGLSEGERQDQTGHCENFVRSCTHLAAEHMSPTSAWLNVDSTLSALWTDTAGQSRVLDLSARASRVKLTRNFCPSS